MTNERARSELMQIYGSLSSGKQQALDVAFKAMEQADNIPVMYYPQVDGITPTVVAQAEVNAHAIQSALDNGTNTVIGTGGMRDATPEEQEAVDKYIKSISKPTGVNFWDLADGEYINKTESLKALNTWDKFGYYNHDMFRLEKDSEKDYVAYIRYDDVVKCIKGMPSVAIQNKVGHWEWVQYDSNPNIGNWHCSECRTIITHMPEETDNTPIYKWCPMCGVKMD